jgi:sugar phosphate isomerase/epimerase
MYGIGVQSFTYREFDLDGMLDALDGTGVDAIELCGVHLDPEADDDHVDAVRERVGDADLSICGFGVEAPDGPENARDRVALADHLGASYLSVMFEPGDTAVIDALCDAAAATGIDLGVHNHGPGHTYATVDDELAVLDGRPDALGACVDTGHFLRSDEPPGDVIPPLGERVHAVHAKDFLDADTEAVLGDGSVDVPELVRLLDEHTDLDAPLVIEYEEDAEDPTHAVETAAERLRAAGA